VLKIEKLNFWVNNKQILKDISFEVKSGEIFNILGYNGSGKTTLLKSLIWLNRISGNIFLWETKINNLEIWEISKKWINYIMQEVPEYNWISVETYLKWVLKNKFNLEKVGKLFLDFWLEYDIYKTRFFDNHLSWWERKKIEIITNFLMDKDIYLLDEIEASLDATSRKILIDLILEYNKAWKTFIIVSHSTDILNLANSWILLCNWLIEQAWNNSKLLVSYFWKCKWCDWEVCKS